MKNTIFKPVEVISYFCNLEMKGAEIQKR